MREAVSGVGQLGSTARRGHGGDAHGVGQNRGQGLHQPRGPPRLRPRLHHAAPGLVLVKGSARLPAAVVDVPHQFQAVSGGNQNSQSLLHSFHHSMVEAFIAGFSHRDNDSYFMHSNVYLVNQ